MSRLGRRFGRRWVWANHRRLARPRVRTRLRSNRRPDWSFWRRRLWRMHDWRPRSNRWLFGVDLRREYWRPFRLYRRDRRRRLRLYGRSLRWRLRLYRWCLWLSRLRLRLCRLIGRLRCPGLPDGRVLEHNQGAIILHDQCVGAWPLYSTGGPDRRADLINSAAVNHKISITLHDGKIIAVAVDTVGGPDRLISALV